MTMLECMLSLDLHRGSLRITLVGYAGCHGGDARQAIAKDVQLLRTRDSYEVDAGATDLPNTGIKSNSPLNSIHHYHVTHNFAPDMHDL